MTARAALPVAAALLISTGCTFSEQIDAPPGQPTVIAQMVLNTAAPVQTLLLERSDGGTSRDPLFGATVRLSHLNPDAACPRPTVTLVEALDTIIYGPTGAGSRVYETRDLCTLRAGDRVSLRIETAQGEVVTGTTQIPGASRTLVRAGTETGLAPRVMPLNRARDSIHVEVEPQFARGLQIEALRKGGNPRRRSPPRPPTSPVFAITTDTMHLTLAGNLVNPFEDGDQQTIFRAGADYLFSFATTDTNYFDYVRSGANPFTGRGFINHLSGGIGVFGSVAPQIYEMRVTAPQHDPREGVYRISGSLPKMGGAPSVDLRFDVYLDEPSGPNRFSALTDGSWVEGPHYASADGDFTGGFHAQFFGQPTDPLGKSWPLYTLDYEGPLPARGTPFTAALTRIVGKDTTSDRVTVVQLSGP